MGWCGWPLLEGVVSKLVRGDSKLWNHDGTLQSYGSKLEVELGFKYEALAATVAWPAW